MQGSAFGPVALAFGVLALPGATADAVDGDRRRALAVVGFMLVARSSPTGCRGPRCWSRPTRRRGCLGGWPPCSSPAGLRSGSRRRGRLRRHRHGDVLARLHRVVPEVVPKAAPGGQRPPAPGDERGPHRRLRRRRSDDRRGRGRLGDGVNAAPLRLVALLASLRCRQSSARAPMVRAPTCSVTCGRVARVPLPAVAVGRRPAVFIRDHGARPSWPSLARSTPRGTSAGRRAGPVVGAEAIGMVVGVVFAIRAKPKRPIRLVVLLTFPLALLPLAMGLGLPMYLTVAAAFFGGIASTFSSSCGKRRCSARFAGGTVPGELVRRWERWPSARSASAGRAEHRCGRTDRCHAHQCRGHGGGVRRRAAVPGVRTLEWSTPQDDNSPAEPAGAGRPARWRRR